MEIIYTAHATAMLNERKIPTEWIKQTILDPDRTYTGDDENIHYLKSIPEFGNRVLRVIVKPTTIPLTVITLFFDRRVKKHANTSR